MTIILHIRKDIKISKDIIMLADVKMKKDFKY